MDYSIPWHLLSDDDADFLDQAGIERGLSFIKFNRELSRKELALVCSRLVNFRSIIPDPKENHINFAIGEAFNEFSQRFGKKDGKYFLKNFVRVGKLRDKTLNVTGAALIYLQTVENLIKGCCAMLKLKGIKLTVADFQSDDASRRRQTLGQLKAALLGTFAFSDDFEDRFNAFVRGRNEFIHTFWTGETEIDTRTGLPSEHHFNEKLKFMFSLMSQAREIEYVFRGLFASMGEAFQKATKNDQEPFLWKRFIPNFKATLRGDKD
jgi:hypothetical protein